MPTPDLIALKKGNALIFECKAWKGNYLSVSNTQMSELVKWGEISGASVFVAWKYPNKGWFFIKPKQFNKSKHYNISFPNAQKKGVSLEVLLGEQSQLKV